jgi:hypothetical protein
MEAPALYLRDGDSFVGTILTQGGWDPDAANGGAVLALLGHCLDEVPTLVPMTLSRFTADLVRPVPIGQRIRVVASILREGKKIQVVQLLLTVDDVEHVRATALRLRDANLSDADLPPSTTTDRPADALTPPEAARSFREGRSEMPGFLRAIDMRRAPATRGSGAGCWVHLDVSVVAGEPVRPTARLTVGFDYANLIGVDPTIGTATMINPDVTAHVVRMPVDEWIAITGDTRFNHTLGRGVSSALLSDSDGVFAVVSTSQLVQPS